MGSSYSLLLVAGALNLAALESYYSLLLAAGGAFALWKITGKILRHYLTSKLTILNDIPKLGNGRKRSQKLSGTVVICGGSIAGLWTARVCSDHFENVIIVEPETWLSESEAKSGAGIEPEVRIIDGHRTKVNKRTRVFQYHALHGYQPLSVLALRKLFPSWDAEARALGILFVPSDLNFFISGLPLLTPYHLYPNGKMPDIMVSTRPTYEKLLRKLVQESCPNVQFIVGTVTGVIPGQNHRLEGVSIRIDGHSEPKVQPAELIIDCTGRTQAGLKWLSRAGYGVPRPDSKPKPGQLPISDLRIEYNQNLRYVCIEYSVPAELKTKLPIPGGYDNAGWLFALVPFPKRDRKLIMGTRFENDTIQYAFGSWGDTPMPKNHADMVEFMDSLALEPGYSLPQWTADTLALLAANQPEPFRHVYQTPPSSFVRYQQAMNLPSNFIAIGDAMMKVNPVFAQGCTKACIGAVTLDSVLANTKGGIPDDFGPRFFSAHASRTIGFWEESDEGTSLPSEHTIKDYKFSTTTPVKGEEEAMEKILQTGGGFMGQYGDHVMRLSAKDRDVGAAFWSILMMLAPPTDILLPSVVRKVAWNWLLG